MKAIINSKELESELKVIQTVIRKNSVIPITSGIKMDFTKNKVVVTGTDLETTAVFSLDCECKEPFCIVIGFDDILKVCSRLSEPITIESKEDCILMSGMDSKFKFSKIGEAEHFPLTPDEELTLWVDVDCDFFYALSNANACRTKDDMHPNRNMPCIDFKKKSASIVGTDGSVLYLKELSCKPTEQSRIMIPDIFVQLTKSFQDSTIYVNEKYIKAEYGNKIIISRLSENKFVPYEAILPKDAVYNFAVNKNDLQKALQVVGITASIITGVCILSFKKDELVISSQDIDFGKESSTRLTVTHSVEIDSIGINGGQMLHLLNLIDAEDIEMAFTTPQKTIYIKPVGDDTVISLIQPIFID